MNTDYDTIAEQYRRAKRQPWREHIEAFTLMTLMGDPTGKAVLDIACGEGFYSRMIRRRGAAKVMGVDLSEGMIALAKATEAEQRLGIDYIVGDGLNLRLSPQYDLAVAAYLLNYAHSRTELDAMCAGIARCLRPGGRFVTVNTNPACHFPSAPSFRKYGFDTSVSGSYHESAPITFTFYLDNGSFNIENYFLSVKTHEEALRGAGFRDIRWHQPQLSPEAKVTFGQEFWSLFLAQAPIVFLDCVA